MCIRRQFMKSFEETAVPCPMPPLSSCLLCSHINRLQALDERWMAVVHCTVERVAGWRAPVLRVQTQQASLQVLGLPETHRELVSLVLKPPGQRVGEQAQHLQPDSTGRETCCLASRWLEA